MLQTLEEQSKISYIVPIFLFLDFEFFFFDIVSDFEFIL
jgi:hypothetical protein